MKKWYEVNLNTSKAYSCYRKARYIDVQELYKKFLAGELGGTQQPPQKQPECESTFCDNFESSWISLNTYVLQVGETFQSLWFTNNSFINECKDNFEMGWFTSNSYLGQWFEGFEGVDWDE